MLAKGWRLALVGLAGFLGACSELTPSTPSLEVVVPQSLDVQVTDKREYTVGSFQIRGRDINGTLSVSVTLPNPPDGIRLVSPTSVSVGNTLFEGNLRLEIDPDVVLGNGTQRTVSLEFQISAQGISPVTKTISLTIRRQAQPAPILRLELIPPIGPVDVSGKNIYPSGRIRVTGQNVTSPISVNVSISARDGIRLDSPTRLTVGSAPVERTIQLEIDPDVVLGNNPQRTVVIEVQIDAQGVPSIADEFTLTIRRSGGSGGGTPTPPQLTLSLAPSTLSVNPGDSATAVATVSSTGVSGTVEFYLVSSPAGITMDPATATVTPGSQVSTALTFRVGTSTLPGTYNLAVGVRSATNASVMDVKPLTVRVSGLQATLSLDRLTAYPGETITGSLTLKSLGGAQGTVYVSISACQSSYTVSYSPTTTLGAGDTRTVPFQIVLPGNASSGRCAVNATAYLGTLVASDSAAFDVLINPQVSLHVGNGFISAGTNVASFSTYLEVTPSWNGLLTVLLTGPNGYAGNWRLVSSDGTVLAQGQAGNVSYINYSDPIDAFLVLDGLAGFADGTYEFQFLVQGPINSTTATFKLFVAP